MKTLHADLNEQITDEEYQRTIDAWVSAIWEESDDDGDDL